MNNNWDELLDAASKRENIQFPECNFDFKAVYKQTLAKQQEELNALPPAKEGYHWVWCECLVHPTPKDFVHWKQVKNSTFTDIYVSPEAMEDIKNWANSVNG